MNTRLSSTFDDTARLLVESSNGDDAAITRLLWAYYDRLANYISPLIPATLRGQIDADDLLQDTFTTAWMKIASLKFEHEGAFQAWLRTILRRKLLDRIRAANRHKRGGNDCLATQELLELMASKSRSPSSLIAGNEAEFKLRVAIVELSERHQEVLEYRFLQGLSVSETATRMGCSAGAIHMLTNRAIKSLRLVMGNESRFFSMK